MALSAQLWAKIQAWNTTVFSPVLLVLQLLLPFTTAARCLCLQVDISHPLLPPAVLDVLPPSSTAAACLVRLHACIHQQQSTSCIHTAANSCRACCDPPLAALCFCLPPLNLLPVRLQCCLTLLVGTIDLCGTAQNSTPQHATEQHSSQCAWCKLLCCLTLLVGTIDLCGTAQHSTGMRVPRQQPNQVK
jgi:hypothetical protein